jgi:hypothetical protein
MIEHKQVQVKVNAYVDEGVSPLVCALNELEGVITIDSCEGYADDPSYVYFHLLSLSEDCALFAHKLASALHSQIQGRWDYFVGVEWSSGEPMLQIRVPRNFVGQTAEAIRSIVSRLRSSASRHDTCDRAPHSLTKCPHLPNLPP